MFLTFKIKHSHYHILQDTQSEVSQSDPGDQSHPLRPTRSQARTTSRVSNQSSHSKNKRSSVASLPPSLLNLGEVNMTVYLESELSHLDFFF